MSLKDKAAIVGVGETKIGRVPGVTILGFELEAAAKAIQDAGLKKEDIDGLLAQPPNEKPVYGYSSVVAQRLGIKPTFMTDVNTMGASQTTMAILAAMAVDAGLCNHVLCTYGRSSQSREWTPRGEQGGDAPDYSTPYGHLGAPANYAMAARRHMHEYGTTSRQFGAIAVAMRKHASLNPNAQMRTPITLEDHQNSRWIVEPFHLMDCCLQSDGGGAFIVTSARRAKQLKQRPVYIMGAGEHNPHSELYNADSLTTVGSKLSSERAYKMAGIGPKDIDVAEIYDCFTYTVLVTLEDYGFCKKGEGGSFVEGGHIELGGELPVNTHGGLLSQGHIEGMLHILEAVRQLRGECGERQVPDAEVAIVSGQGGIFSTHNTLILRR